MLDIDITNAESIRVILEHRRESHVALFSLDGRPNLKTVRVDCTSPASYQSLLVSVQGVRHERYETDRTASTSPQVASSVNDGAECEKVASRAVSENLEHLKFLLQLVELEMIERERRSSERRLKAAKFPYHKMLEEFGFTLRPRSTNRWCWNAAW